MSESEAKDFAATQQTLIIVSNGKDGYPHPMPMWFAVDDEGRFLVSTFARSQKVLNFKHDPRATLLIEGGTTYESLRGLVVRARTEIIERAEDVVEAMVNIRLKGAQISEAKRKELRAGLRHAAAKRVILRFTAESSFSWDHSKLAGVY